MAYKLNVIQVDALLSALGREYKIFAPKRFVNQGRYSDTDIIRYDEVRSFSDIVWNQKSDYPAKEVINPIQQSLFYFTEDEYRESKGPDKPLLIFARPCDINAQEIQEKIFAGNGGFTDVYYERMRACVKFAMMECCDEDDSCFCVSMGANRTENYSLAVKFSPEGAEVKLKDADFAPYFEAYPTCSYTPAFKEKNALQLTVPKLDDRELRLALKKHPMWREFDSRCISCGACTIACSTCSCFTARDIAYGENPEVGERRRVSASCQIEGFDQMAGQPEIRSSAGERMRYKILHKFHDYKARFGGSHMCVGCGRCMNRCPEMISVVATVNKMNAAVEEIMADPARQ